MINYQHISASVIEAQDKLKNIHNGSLIPLLTSSKKESDMIGGYFPSSQIIIAGRPGSGKTAKLLCDIQDFCNTEINPNYKDKLIILYDSWEMTGWRNIIRMYSRETRNTVKNILDHKQKISDEAMLRMNTISEKLKRYPIWISQTSTDVDDWYEAKSRLMQENPDKLIVNVVDHTRLITTSNEKTEEQLLHRFMKAGMSLKNEYNCINIFLSQLNRNIETNSRSREDMGKSLPTSSDLFGGDTVFQSADIVLGLHRPGMYNLYEWNGIPTGKDIDDPYKEDDLLIECCLKQRDGWTGNLLMRHELKYNKIIDYERT